MWFYHECIKRGVSPESFWTMTLAEVSSVVKRLYFSDELAWNHTASTLSLTANINAPKGKRYKPEDFMPYSGKKKQPTKEDAKKLYETFKNF